MRFLSSNCFGPRKPELCSPTHSLFGKVNTFKIKKKGFEINVILWLTNLPKLLKKVAYLCKVSKVTQTV